MILVKLQQQPFLLILSLRHYCFHTTSTCSLQPDVVAQAGVVERVSVGAVLGAGGAEEPVARWALRVATWALKAR